MKTILTSLLLCAFAFSAPAAEYERQVGLFYFLWLGEHGRKGPWDVSKIVEADSDAGQKPDGPMWGPWGAYHHWGEPLYGYYFSDDEWVVRRHMKLIMKAGIGFLFFDTTNGPIYEKNAKLVMRVLQVCFGFKFVDSAVSCNGPMDWYDHGVVEPLGRIEFYYRGKDSYETHCCFSADGVVDSRRRIFHGGASRPENA